MKLLINQEQVNIEWRKCLDELNDCPSIETETPLLLKLFLKIGVPVFIGFLLARFVYMSALL